MWLKFLEATIVKKETKFTMKAANLSYLRSIFLLWIYAGNVFDSSRQRDRLVFSLNLIIKLHKIEI